MSMIKEEGWMDVGTNSEKCGGHPNQPTCQVNASSRETRIDYVIANDRLSLAITTCKVDRLADYPTHKPIGIEIQTEKLQSTTNENVKPTDFAELFEEKVRENARMRRLQLIRRG